MVMKLVDGKSGGGGRRREEWGGGGRVYRQFK